eukprot:6184761-Pleurochrysis_carterae.AAC.1
MCFADGVYRLLERQLAASAGYIRNIEVGRNAQMQCTRQLSQLSERVAKAATRKATGNTHAQIAQPVQGSALSGLDASRRLA